MKKIIAFFFIVYSISSFSQRKYSQQFSILNDNDLYISTVQDRYYTNGLFLSYDYLSNKRDNYLLKRIYKIQIGQKMYSPYKANVSSLSEHDRPFAAYLYGGFGMRNFYANNTSIQLSGEIGILGPSAKGQELMNFIHDIYGFNRADGWKYQIKDAFAFNFSADYTKHINAISNKNFDVNWKNTLNVGTVFTDLSTGFLSRFGVQSLSSFSNSIAFNSNLNDDNSKSYNNSEFFFFINPMLRYTLYDATIQGSFLHDNNTVTYDVRPFVLTTTAGLQFTANRFNFGFSVTHHTRKLDNDLVPNSNFYGSILLNYQFN